MQGFRLVADSATPEQIQAICIKLSEGVSLRKIAKDMGIGESTVRYWFVKDAEAFAHSARARELGCDALADECLEIADDKAIDPADKRIRIDTRIRLIGKWSQRYSDKVTVKSESVVTHRYDLDNLSTTELDQLETILANAARGESGESTAVPAIVH
jgi:hypothetical protein